MLVFIYALTRINSFTVVDFIRTALSKLSRGCWGNFNWCFQTQSKYGAFSYLLKWVAIDFTLTAFGFCHFQGQVPWGLEFDANIGMKKEQPTLNHQRPGLVQTAGQQDSVRRRWPRGAPVRCTGNSAHSASPVTQRGRQVWQVQPDHRARPK